MTLSTSLDASQKICLISLGCPKNLVDAEMMLGFLKKDGFGFTVTPEEAEIIVVNTCGFIEDSKRESIDKILEMAKYKETARCKVLVATGCLSQRYSEELSKEFPEVDLFIGTGEFDKLSDLLRKKFVPSLSWQRGEFGSGLISHRQILPDPDLPRVLATPSHYSYLKISEGCSHVCSFCIIPMIRGKLKSRSQDSVVREVESLAAQGVKEFNMIAQDLNEYGRDLKNGTSLSTLLQALENIRGDFWLRPHYMYPLEFTDTLIGVLRDSEHVLKYVDMPLQHINERVLLSMKRGSPGRYVRQVLSKLKKNIPSVTLRTTFIVGYPGETEEEFQELCDFISEYEFDRVGVFKYSAEEGTTAALLEDSIPPDTKTERYDRLMKLQQKISLRKNKSLMGQTFTGLYEGDWARLPSQAPEIDGVTYLESKKNTPPLKVGDFVSIQITGAREYDLVGAVTR